MLHFALHHLSIVIPLYFMTLWIGVTTLLGFLSGWYRLAARFPDRLEAPILRLSSQSGSMGLGVQLNSVLTLAACPGGLRISVWRVLGPFQRPLFVPWDQLAVTTESARGRPAAKLRLGRPPFGTLRLSSFVADRLHLAERATGHLFQNEP